MKDIFEIHAPGIDSQEIVETIENRVQERGYDLDEQRRIERLSFAPVSPASEHVFDPAVTSELFERPVPAPDFRSPKYRRFRGPLKTFARLLFNFFSSLHDKLSQNKIQAFYNVVHELIAVNYRLERMQSRLESVSGENFELRSRLASLSDGNRGTDAGVAGPALPELPEAVRSMNDAVARELREASGFPDGPLLCLDDRNGGLAAALSAAGFSRNDLFLHADDHGTYLRLQGAYPDRVERLAADALLSRHNDVSVAAVLVPNLCETSGLVELLPELCARKLKPGGYLYARADRGLRSSPFSRGGLYDVDFVVFKKLCEGLGFRIVTENLPQELKDGSFELLLEKIP